MALRTASTLCALVMGFLLGFIMLLYLWERSVSHRQKMGILTGASCQIVGKYLHSGSFRWALI